LALRRREAADRPSADRPSPHRPPADRPSVERPAGSPDVRERAIPLRGGRAPRRPRRTALLFALGVLGALFCIAAVWLLTGSGDDGKKAAAAPPASPSASGPAVPAGARCTGQSCAGQDPETMGCGGEHATTAGSVTVGSSYLEVRYSELCGAAWARITQAEPGDALRITAPGTREQGTRVAKGTDGHTAMLAVTRPDQATACATLTGGRKGCTHPG
ncbi:DUF2690 domain-containing protein, partial [Streptomyces sp. NPDC049577]|uniref:DUF2690 domain-containing protein n=1 Tax=Streptomyces sp. NPDC049577 TaxID=3155153 RepID=UPI00343D6238